MNLVGKYFCVRQRQRHVFVGLVTGHDGDAIMVRYFDMMGDPLLCEQLTTRQALNGANIFTDYEKADEQRMYWLEMLRPDEVKLWRERRAMRETEARHARYQADPYEAGSNVNEKARLHNERRRGV